MNVAELRILRFMCGVTRMNKVRNDFIRGTVKVSQINKKVQEGRLRWFGHIRRGSDEYVSRKVEEMTIGRKKRRGKPRIRWIENLRKDLRKKRLREEDAKDKGTWRVRIKNA